MFRKLFKIRSFIYSKADIVLDEINGRNQPGSFGYEINVWRVD